MIENAAAVVVQTEADRLISRFFCVVFTLIDRTGSCAVTESSMANADEAAAELDAFVPALAEVYDISPA